MVRIKEAASIIGNYTLAPATVLSRELIQKYPYTCSQDPASHLISPTNGSKIVLGTQCFDPACDGKVVLSVRYLKRDLSQTERMLLKLAPSFSNNHNPNS